MQDLNKIEYAIILVILREYRLRRYFLLDKKRGNEGIKDSYFHMSPTRGDALQGTFFDMTSISSPTIFPT